MDKKVYFYKIELHKSSDSTFLNHDQIKELFIEIIELYSQTCEDFCILDLTKENELHYLADIFTYKDDKLFMRISSQKPAGGFLRRDYSTNIPEGVLAGYSEDKMGIEVYTYVLIDYETGILSIIHNQSAPSYRIINYFLSKYNDKYYMDFIPIPNPFGIQRIYEAQEPQITQIEIEVPVPSAEALESMFGWSARDILDIQGNKLKATMRLSALERGVITNTCFETKSIIDRIRSTKNHYFKAKIRAKTEERKTQDYNFFEENFSYPVEIQSYQIKDGQKYYLSHNDLISVYRDNLAMAYNANLATIKTLTSR